MTRLSIVEEIALQREINLRRRGTRQRVVVKTSRYVDRDYWDKRHTARVAPCELCGRFLSVWDDNWLLRGHFPLTNSDWLPPHFKRPLTMCGECLSPIVELLDKSKRDFDKAADRRQQHADEASKCIACGNCFQANALYHSHFPRDIYRYVSRSYPRLMFCRRKECVEKVRQVRERRPRMAKLGLPKDEWDFWKAIDNSPELFSVVETACVVADLRRASKEAASSTGDSNVRPSRKQQSENKQRRLAPTYRKEIRVAEHDFYGVTYGADIERVTRRSV